MAAKKATRPAEPGAPIITIARPDIRTVTFRIRGSAPYVGNRFANKAAIMAKQQEGSTANKGKARAPKDFDACYEAAKHVCVDRRTNESWCGIPASSLRNAMISACRLVSFKMTIAKMSVFVVADGLDQDGLPIIRIEGTPERYDAYVRNETGVVDIRARPMWKEWHCDVKIRFDAAQFTATDVANLMMRAGIQVGLGEGRPDSKASAGVGFGTFDLVEDAEAAE